MRWLDELLTEHRPAALAAAADGFLIAAVISMCERQDIVRSTLALGGRGTVR